MTPGIKIRLPVWGGLRREPARHRPFRGYQNRARLVTHNAYISKSLANFFLKISIFARTDLIMPQPTVFLYHN